MSLTHIDDVGVVAFRQPLSGSACPGTDQKPRAMGAGPLAHGNAGEKKARASREERVSERPERRIDEVQASRPRGRVKSDK